MYHRFRFLSGLMAGVVFVGAFFATTADCIGAEGSIVRPFEGWGKLTAGNDIDRLVMAGLRQKMGYSDVPGPFRGVPIAMIVTCVLAMAFMGFAGMVSIQ